MKRCGRFLFIALALALVGLMFTAARPALADIIYASQDTYTAEGTKTTNFNNQGITVKYQYPTGSTLRYGWLEFQLPAATVDSAILMMYQTGMWNNQGNYTVGLRGSVTNPVNDSSGNHWNESTMAWSAATTPPPYGQPGVTGWQALPTSPKLPWTAVLNEPVGLDPPTFPLRWYCANITEWVNGNLGELATIRLISNVTGSKYINFGGTYEDSEGSKGTTNYPYITTVPDTSPPSVPTGLSAVVKTTTSIELRWTASTDDMCPPAYNVYRDGAFIKKVPYAYTVSSSTGVKGDTVYLDEGLTANQTYTYRVTAFDCGVNETAPSDPLEVTCTPPDTTPPSVPGSLTALTSCNAVRLSWTASTDNTAVTGYRIWKGNPLVAVTTTTALTWLDTNEPASTAQDYGVSAYDAATNQSDKALVTATTLACLDGDAVKEIVFDFDDQSTNVFVDPTQFYTAAEAPAAANNWLGQKVDGTVYWSKYAPSPQTPENHFQCAFNVAAGDGDLTIQSNTPADQDGGKNGITYIRSNEFGNWFRWSYDPNYDPDGPGGEDPYTYMRGISVEADINLVGDVNGWCAAWDTWPFVSPCTETSRELLHQASDWGGGNGDMNTIYLAVGDAWDLTEAGHTALSGDTGNGVAYWISLKPGAVQSATDDRISLWSPINYDHATFAFTDNLGFGLNPEDGDGSDPRNGTITGAGNHLILKAAMVNAGGNDEYIDIWLTRPNGVIRHVNPATCRWIDSAQNLSNKPGFGVDGHTFKVTYSNKDGNTTSNQIALGVNYAPNPPAQIWGTKYNSIKVRNDWNGQAIIKVEKLGDLRKLGTGSLVTFDDTGGEKVVSNETTMSVDGNTPYFYYVEQEDRSAGVRIMVADDAATPNRGDKVSVKGAVGKDADGNLYVDTRALGGYCNLTPGGQVVAPLSLTNKAAGGSQVTGGAGAENVGLLATVWGKVSNVVYTPGTGVLTFDLDDGSATPVSVADYAGDGQIAVGDRPVAGKYWKATGILALRLDGSDYKRLLIVDGVDVEEMK